MLNRFDEVGVSQAEIGFRAALARDPSFVRAREELTFTHFIQAAWGFSDAKSGFALAEQDAEGLLVSDLGSGYAKAVLGSIALFRFDWAEADRQLTAARLVSPNNLFALFSSGDLAAAFGRWAEATKYYNMILLFDPLNSNTWNELGFQLYRAGRLPEGEAAVRRCLAITPTFATARADLGFILLARGQPTEALAEMEQDSDGGFGSMGRALAFRALGRKADADLALVELTSSSADRHAYRVAQVHAVRGERDEAFRWLDRAYTQQDAELQYIKGSRYCAVLKGTGATMRSCGR
jgi:tetratricopeptide (TPR) repeat protein